MASGKDIVIVHPMPLFVDGVTAALRGCDFNPRTVTHLDHLDLGSDAAILLALHAAADWEWLDKASRANRCVIAVLSRADEGAYRRALRRGALAVVGEEAPAMDVVHVIREATCGRTSLPSAVAAALASAGPVPAAEAGLRISDAESLWLRSLASGTSIAQIAARACYSEREMYRLLNDLYSRIGARNRSEAIVNATKAGVIR